MEPLIKLTSTSAHYFGLYPYLSIKTELEMARMNKVRKKTELEEKWTT